MNIFNKKEVINSGFVLLQGWCTWPVMNTFGLSLWKTFRNECSKKKGLLVGKYRRFFLLGWEMGVGSFLVKKYFMR